MLGVHGSKLRISGTCQWWKFQIAISPDSNENVDSCPPDSEWSNYPDDVQDVMAQGPPTFRVPLLLTIACPPTPASMIEKGQMFPTPCDSVLEASFPLTSLCHLSPCLLSGILCDMCFLLCEGHPSQPPTGHSCRLRGASYKGLWWNRDPWAKHLLPSQINACNRSTSSNLILAI